MRAAGGHRTLCFGLEDQRVRRVHYDRRTRLAVMAVGAVAPSRTRTCARRLRRPLLCPLSYRGVGGGGGSRTPCAAWTSGLQPGGAPLPRLHRVVRPSVDGRTRCSPWPRATRR